MRVISPGQRYGKLVVLHQADPPKTSEGQHKHWMCQCDCGNKSIVSSGNLGRQTFSCGCKRRESKNMTHGCASHKTYNKLYHTWNGIKYRCYNPKCKDYKHYGGRGIKMCDEWLHDFPSFQQWAKINGFAEDLTIDRIDVNGNYEPSNCRWITVAEQNRNKRKKVSK